MKRIITLGLLACLSLTACTVGIVRQEVLLTPAVDASLTPEPTLVTPTSEPPTSTSTPEPPTSTPTITPTLPPAPTNVPVPTQTPASPRLLLFEVTPEDVVPGDTVTLTWDARGDEVMICPGPVESDDCWRVPQTGTTTFDLPADSYSVERFVLAVWTHGRSWPATVELLVPYRCYKEWFFGESYGRGCPAGTVRSFAAAQRFERGTMIWVEEFGRYVVLTRALVPGDWRRKQVYYVDDPLDIVRNTSSGIEPPEGLYAPVSGFGLVWRGDVSQSPGYRESLGWALGPEFGYETVHQCTLGYVSDGRWWRNCYLKGPDGEAIYFHPLGGWLLLGE